jgi:hypothetical protein
MQPAEDQDQDQEQEILNHLQYIQNQRVELQNRQSALTTDENTLLERLRALRITNRNATRNNPAPRPTRPAPRNPRPLTIGDYVRIRNPNIGQATHGVITRIGTFVTVRASSGEQVRRAPHNLVIARRANP